MRYNRTDNTLKNIAFYKSDPSLSRMTLEIIKFISQNGHHLIA